MAVWRDRVFRGMEKAPKTFWIEISDPRIPSKNSFFEWMRESASFSTGCVDRLARSKKLGSKRLRSGLPSETGLFDPRI